MYRISLFLFAVSVFVYSCKDDEGDVPEKSTKMNVPEFATTDGGIPEYQMIADVTNSILKPKDLAFQTTAGRVPALWVINYGTEFSGGSTVMITDPGTSEQKTTLKKDGNSRHFMALPTALAFSENGDWATSSGILDANGQGGAYTGPTLWPGDLSIYSNVGNPPTIKVNGSHLDMVHQSPTAMGICNLKGNEYFVFDGYHGDLVYYDFVSGHQPGGDDHSDARVIHYHVSLKRDPSGFLPGHMEIDADKKYLYAVDTDRKRVVKVDITSGETTGAITVPLMHGERLAFFGEQKDVDWSVFAESNLVRPCGLAIKDDRIFISDNGTNEIICFDANDGSELGRIEVEAIELMGIEIGPDGHLYYVDYSLSKVFRVNPR